MNKTLKLVIFLSLISALSGTALSYVNSLTEPVIEQNAITKENNNLQAIVPNGTFESIDFTDDSGYVETVYKVENTGYIFKCSGLGFNTSSPITFLIAFDNDGNTIGYQVIDQQETNGFGSKIEEEPFIENVMSKTVDQEIDLITGATFSSTAVKNGIDAAKVVFAQVKDGE